MSPYLPYFLEINYSMHINPIRLKWVPIWHPLPLSLYLRHGFCSEYEDVAANRVKQQFKITKQVYISLFVIGCWLALKFICSANCFVQYCTLKKGENIFICWVFAVSCKRTNCCNSVKIAIIFSLLLSWLMLLLYQKMSWRYS